MNPSSRTPVMALEPLDDAPTANNQTYPGRLRLRTEYSLNYGAKLVLLALDPRVNATIFTGPEPDPRESGHDRSVDTTVELILDLSKVDPQQHVAFDSFWRLHSQSAKLRCYTAAERPVLIRQAQVRAIELIEKLAARNLARSTKPEQTQSFKEVQNGKR